MDESGEVPRLRPLPAARAGGLHPAQGCNGERGGLLKDFLEEEQEHRFLFVREKECVNKSCKRLKQIFRKEGYDQILDQAGKITNMEISDYLSIIALIISSISLFITWREYRRNRGFLSLGLLFENRVGKGPAYSLRFTNSGRRIITINKCFVRLKSGRKYPVLEDPTALEESEFLDLVVPLEGFHSISHPLEMVSFEAEDTTGKTYKIDTKKIKRQVEKTWQ